MAEIQSFSCRETEAVGDPYNAIEDFSREEARESCDSIIHRIFLSRGLSYCPVCNYAFPPVRVLHPLDEEDDDYFADWAQSNGHRTTSIIAASVCILALFCILSITVTIY